MSETVTQYIAATNIVLGLVGFGWLLTRTVRRKEEYPEEVLKLLYLATTLFFGLLTTSIVAYLRGAYPPNALVISAVKLWALYVLWTTRHTKYRTGTRQADGNPQADQNKDIP